MRNLIFSTYLSPLLLGSHVFASPSTNQLGDIHILAADDLISMCSTANLLHVTENCVKPRTTVLQVLHCS
jgi:hypothetical protein